MTYCRSWFETFSKTCTKTVIQVRHSEFDYGEGALGPEMQRLMFYVLDVYGY